MTLARAGTRMGELWPLFWDAARETLIMLAFTMTIGAALGLLLGLSLYLTRPGSLFANRAVSFLLNLVVNFFRPIPFVIFIAAVQPLAREVVGIGIGIRAAIFALILALMFAFSRIVEQNLVTVPAGVIEAARAMGASRLRIAGTVLIPEALGPLTLGYTYAWIAVIDASAVAGAIGAGGLGQFAQQYGYRQYDDVVTWTTVIALVVLVTVIQFVGSRIANHILRR